MINEKDEYIVYYWLGEISNNNNWISNEIINERNNINEQSDENNIKEQGIHLTDNIKIVEKNAKAYSINNNSLRLF